MVKVNVPADFDAASDRLFEPLEVNAIWEASTLFRDILARPGNNLGDLFNRISIEQEDLAEMARRIDAARTSGEDYI